MQTIHTYIMHTYIHTQRYSNHAYSKDRKGQLCCDAMRGPEDELNTFLAATILHGAL